jgi:tellurite methyltransferase
MQLSESCHLGSSPSPAALGRNEIDHMNQHISWKKYIDKTADRPPRPLLIEALPYVAYKYQVLDVGAGALMDSRYLLSEGFKHVTAVDSDPASEEKSKQISSPNFSFICQSLELIELPSDTYDLINAQRILPYIAPKDFERVLDKLKKALRKDGIFAIQTFGDRDKSILAGVEMTRLSREEVESYFSDMEILKIEETEEDKESTLGKIKHFHEFGIILRKK